MGKKLVAYFSATGTTAKVASHLADALGADIFEIEPEKLYTEKDLEWTNLQSRSTREMADPNARPGIVRLRENMYEYDTLYIGFPVWWHAAPRIINTFLESYDLNGKTIIPFATSGGSGMEEINDSINISCQRAKLKEGRILREDTTYQELDSWGNKIF